MKKAFALAIADLRVTLRRGEALVLNLIVPMVVLIALAQGSGGITKAMPFSFLQAVLATSMVSLGITTGFDRRFRVLVRLGTTPLGRSGLILSKIMSMIIAQIFQLIVLGALGVALGWEVTPRWMLAIMFCWIGSCAFAGIALSIAGRVRAEANLGLQNLLYLFMMGVGGIALASDIPRGVEVMSYMVPSGSLHALLRWCAGLEAFPVMALVVLSIQAVVFPIIASRSFSFDES